MRACLQKAPGARYQSAHELVHALDLVRQRPALRPCGCPAPDRGSPAVAATLVVAVPSGRGERGLSGAAHSALDDAAVDRRPRWGSILLLVGLASAVAAVILRLHLWFTVRSYPAEWAMQRAHSRALDHCGRSALRRARWPRRRRRHPRRTRRVAAHAHRRRGGRAGVVGDHRTRHDAGGVWTRQRVAHPPDGGLTRDA